MTETFQPFPNQIPMIDHLLDNDRAALFVSPGKGKTVVTLTALDALATLGDFKAALKEAGPSGVPAPSIARMVPDVPSMGQLGGRLWRAQKCSEPDRW